MILSRQTDYKPAKDVSFSWDTFRRGLNTLLRENEIGNDELAQADNLLLKGKGIPTKRWGTSLYYQAGNATGMVRGLKGFYKSDGTNELLAITDDGYLTKRNGNTFSTLIGASWASGSDVTMAQLNNKMYIVNGQRELVRYSSPGLVGFATLSVPIILSATNLSGATGTTTKSYRVTAVSTVGETLGSTAFTLIGQPATLGGIAGGVLRVGFTGVSSASILVGYNVYGRDGGNERFLASVPPGTSTYDDDGSSVPSEFSYPPTADSTGGPKASRIIRHQDRLVFAGLSGEPSKVLISGRSPYNERFDLASGGNFINIEQDSGDDIVQIASFRDRIVALKQKSIWQITLGSEQIGNFFITSPSLQLITNSYGCIAPKSVVAVEQDLMFLGRDGVYTLGYQSGFAFDVLRANGVSTKVRTFFDNLTVTQKMGAVGIYFKKKYIIAIPGLNKSIVFDTERGAWMGPWSVDGNVFEVYADSNSNEHLLFGHDDSTNVDEYSETFTTDNGTAIQTTLKTKQEDFSDWSLFKNMKSIFFEFQNITGTANVNIRLEQRNGAVITAKSFNVTPNTGNSGWGSDMWGTAVWGTSNGAANNTDAQQTIKWRELNKLARTVQMTIKTTSVNDNYELLGIRGNAKPVGSGVRPSAWKQ